MGKKNGKHIVPRDRIVQILNMASGVDDITDATNLEDLGFDSIDVIELAMDLEEQFQIKEGIFDERLELTTTVADITKLVEQHKGE